MGLPPKALKKGITDMVRISDARMSGTAYGTVVFHTAPEAARGGPLAVVCDGDIIDLAAARGLTLFATWRSHHAPAVDAARVWLSDKTVTTLEIEWKEDVRHWHLGQDWLWQAGGLGIFDRGINALSVMTTIFPRFMRVFRNCWPQAGAKPTCRRCAMWPMPLLWGVG